MRTSPTFRRRRLARRIKSLREQAGMTQDRAAAELDMSKSALSRKETGEAAATVHEVRSMMDLYDIYDPDLLDLARAAKQKGWWRTYGVEDRGYVDLETEASWVRELSLMYIPGLLQTEEYMRAIFRADRLRRSKQDFDNQVAVRLIRQERLTDQELPLRFTAIVDEHALQRPIVRRSAMLAQLKHVLKMAALETVQLHVMPERLGPYLGMDGAFHLLDFPDASDKPLLYIAYPTGSLHTEKEADVGAANLLFEQMLEEACCPSQSVELIEEAARKL